MLQKIDQGINNMSLRERILLVITIAAVVCMLLDMQFLRPLEKKKRSITGKISALQQQIEEIGERLAKGGGANESDNDLTIIGDLTSANNEVSERLSQHSARLAQSDYALTVLSQYAQPQQERVKVTAIQNIPPVLIKNETIQYNVESVTDISETLSDTQEPQQEAQWYRHGLITQATGYNDNLLAYIQDLESAQIKLAWDSLVWIEGKDEQSDLLLYAYTVSEDPYWLKVE